MSLDPDAFQQLVSIFFYILYNLKKIIYIYIYIYIYTIFYKKMFGKIFFILLNRIKILLLLKRIMREGDRNNMIRLSHEC